MGPGEIRAIRGALSRVAFARLLDVTPLTVLRWELPEENKEARRPRAKMVEALRRLAAEGVGGAATRGDDAGDEDDASEPVGVRLEAPGGAASGEAADEETRVARIVEGIATAEWAKAEGELVSLLAGTALVTRSARTLCALGLAQVQLFARFDVRGAVTTLLPLLADLGSPGLSRAVTARGHVMAAVLFGAPDARVFDPGRVNVNAARARALLGPEDDELRVILAIAQLSASRALGNLAIARLYEDVAPSLDRVRSPLGLAFADQLRSTHASLGGDLATAVRHAQAGVERALRMGLHPIALAALAMRAFWGLRRAAQPADVLAIAAHGREIAKSLPPSEPLLRILAAECEAYVRLGRYEDADRVVREARAMAEAAALPLHAIVGSAARLYVTSARIDEVEALAEVVAREGQALHLVSHGTTSEIHASLLRAIAAMFRGRLSEAAELSARVCDSIDALAGAGADHIIHDARMIFIFARAFGNDLVGTKEGLARAAALLEERPSLWHSAIVRHLEARVAGAEGRVDEMCQKLEAAAATFDLLGDVAHAAHCRLQLGYGRRAFGFADAEARIASARAILDGLGTPVHVMEIAHHGPALRSEGATPTPSWGERVSAAVDRVAARGLPLEAICLEVESVLGELFPGRVATTTQPPSAAHVAFVDVGDGLGGTRRYYVSGPHSAEERSALRMLSTVAAVALEAARGRVATASALDLDPELPGFLAVAPATRRLRREVAQLARANATLLITGESGSGKEVVARAVHDLSPRAKRPYVAFNCASVSRELFDGHLFGFRKGAFTGATADNVGVIRAAEGGTLFLDEIGELPLETQPKLLRFLENGEVFPLGEQRPRRVDVRVVAATHRDLGRLVQEGAFREDLFYRLNVVPVAVPPLRERREDIVPLARLFLGRLASGGDAPDLAGDAVSDLLAHRWPGNVRELRNVVERALAYAAGATLLTAADLRLRPAP